MKPVRTIELTHAVPIDGRSHGRTPAVRLILDERAKLLVEARRFYPGSSDREIARQLHTVQSRYRDGRWRRDREFFTCPVQHRGKLTEVLFLLLRTLDHVPSEMTIRRTLGSRDPRPDG
jgi:hypothetical protein